MDLMEFYKSILKLGLMETDDEGKIFTVDLDTGEKNPIKLDKKQLVLPTSENINTVITDDRGKIRPKYSFFHPCKESDLHPESSVLKKLRLNISARLNFYAYMVSNLILSLMVNDPKNPIITDIYGKVISDRKYTPDEKTLEKFDSLFAIYAKKDVCKSIISFYIKRGGKIGNKKYRRIVSIYYPMYEDLLNIGKDRTLHNIKLRIKDIEVFKGLLRLLFPFIDDEKENQIGSNSKIAPSLDALLRAVEKTSKEILKLTNKLKLDTSDIGGIMEFDFMEYLDNLDKKQSEIDTILIGTDNINKEEDNKETTLINNTTTTHKHGKIDPRELLSKVANRQVNVPNYQTSNTSEIKHTERGIDPRSLINRNMFQAPMQQQFTHQQQPTMYQQPVQYPTMYQQPVQQPTMYQQQNINRFVSTADDDI